MIHDFVASVGYIGLENFCAIVESLAPWTDKTPVEKRATRADYEEALAEAAETRPGAPGAVKDGCSGC